MGAPVIRMSLPLADGNSVAQVWACGNESLAGRKAIADCGSRSASATGLAAAQLVAHTAAMNGLVVVSGHAAGVDEQAHLGALEAEGSTIGVLPEGIGSFRLRAGLRNVATASNFLAVSEFEPTDAWTVGRAMKRNKLLVALVEAVFLIEPGAKGGTFAAGLDGLRARRPVFILSFPTMARAEGTSELVRRGAFTLRSREELDEALRSVIEGTIPSPQLKLAGVEGTA